MAKVERDIVKLEDLVEKVQNALAMFNVLLDEVLEYDNVDYTIFNESEDSITRPKRIDIMKVWSE